MRIFRATVADGAKVFRRLIDEDGDVSAALDRIVGGGLGRAGWAGRGSRVAIREPGEE